MKSAKHGHVKTKDGTAIHYYDVGAGRTIVFIPGWLSDATIWDRQVQALSPSYRVIAIDPRSQGLSDKPSFGHLPEERARDYKELIDTLGLKSPILVGWSMACGEIMRYVEQFGDDELGGIVLVDALLPPAANPNVLPILHYFTRLLQTDRNQAIKEFLQVWYKTEQHESYLRDVTLASERTPTTTAVTLMHNMLANNDFADAFARVSRPVLFAYQPLLQEGANYLKSVLGDRVKLERFDAAGHALFVDDPTRFDSMIDAFARINVPLHNTPQ